MQHPDRQQRVLHLAAADADGLRLRGAGGIAGDGAAQGAFAAGFAAGIGAGSALFDAHVVLIGQEARQIRVGEGLEGLIVERLDGVHVFVRHFARGIDGDLFERDGARAADKVVLRVGHVVIALAAGHRPGAFVGDVALGAAAEEPERDVDALDLLDMVLRGKGLGQKGLFLVMLFEGGDGVGLAEAEGDDIVRFLRAGQAAGDDRGVAAVGAAGRGGRCVADELRAAGRAGIALHPVFGPVAALGRGPGALVAVRCCGGFIRRGGLGRGLCVFALIEGFDLVDGVARSAVVALQPSGRAHEMQGAGTGGALIVGDLICHRRENLLIRVCPRRARAGTQISVRITQ